jgi:sec-independent protein translocase protein TatC
MEKKSGNESEERDPMARMSFLDHLAELRKRLFFSILSIVIGFGVAAPFAKDIFGLVAKPLTTVMAPGQQLAYTRLSEPFVLYMKVSLIAGIFLAAPFVVFQLWLFIAPGLYHRERRYAVPFVVSASFFFLSGGFFAYRVLFPTICRFFLSVGKDFNPVITINEYFSLFSKTLLGIGLVFEMPVLVFFLARFGIVTHTLLLRQWRWAIVLIFIVAAVVTPTPDVVNQSAVALPMIVLYLLSVLVAYVFGKKRGEAGEKDGYALRKEVRVETR